MLQSMGSKRGGHDEVTEQQPFIYLAALGLCCCIWAFPSFEKQASHHSDFFLLQSAGSVDAVHRHLGKSSQTRD